MNRLGARPPQPFNNTPTTISIMMIITIIVNNSNNNNNVDHTPKRGIHCGCSDRTFKECLDKKLFATKDPKDIDNMNENTAVFLWNCFQREMHGVWVSTDQGHLEPRAFGGKFKHQVCVIGASVQARSKLRDDTCLLAAWSLCLITSPACLHVCSADCSHLSMQKV